MQIGRSAPLEAVRAGGPRGRLRIGAVSCALLYLAGMSAYLLFHGGWPTPDYLIPPLLLLAIALGRGWSFLFDWSPFLALVLSWQATAGIANRLGSPVHMVEPVQAERWLFRGNIPTVALQERMFDPAQAHWYDWAATVQHALHFVLPVAVGLVIWLHGRRLYWRYVASILVLFYLGFAGYALYPAAPPWMAGLNETIPPVHRIAVETVLRLPSSAPVGLAYTHFSANQVAAMPSLHAALPLLLALVLIRLYGVRLLPLLLYPAAMGFNLVYLGEHYVVDLLAGYAVGLLAYLAVWELPALLPARWREWRIGLPAVQSGAWSRYAGYVMLPSVAAGCLALIVQSLLPDRPRHTAGPVVPGLAVQAGQSGLLDPVLCGTGSSSSLTAGQHLLPVAERYAAYVFDVDGDACYTLSANASFAPPHTDRVPALVIRAPVRLAPPLRAVSGAELVSLRLGAPAAALLLAGLPADHRYLLLVQLGGVHDAEAAAESIDRLAAIALIPLPAPDITPPPGTEETIFPTPSGTADPLPRVEGQPDVGGAP